MKLNKELSFEDWLSRNEEEVSIYAAETGADRELDFDMEALQEKLYEDENRKNFNRPTEKRVIQDTERNETE